MKAKRISESDLSEALHSSASALMKVGAISEATMRDFQARQPTHGPDVNSEDIVQNRPTNDVSLQVTARSIDNYQSPIKYYDSESAQSPGSDQGDLAPPPFLYKYRTFNRFLLQELCNSTTFFSSPVNFNDPLDSKPSIVNDLDTSQAESLFQNLFNDRWPGLDALREVQECRYLATEHAKDPSESDIALRLVLKHRIEALLHEWISTKGVLSLASSWSCPLMWSHYADQHTGVCLEYSTAGHVAGSIRQVRYDRPRSMNMSDVAKWRLEADPIAKRRVLETAFLSKAPACSYEDEWRILAKGSSSRGAPFDLSAIYFGARCPEAVKTAIVKTMHDVSPKVGMFNACFSTENFQLEREAVWIEEILQVGIRPSAELMFGRHPIESEPEGAIRQNLDNDFY